jgi:hypothetical protein
LYLGFETDSAQRIAAAILFEMTHNLGNGHSFPAQEQLLLTPQPGSSGFPADRVEDCLRDFP